MNSHLNELNIKQSIKYKKLMKKTKNKLSNLTINNHIITPFI